MREDDTGRGMDPRVREDDKGRGMDPRMREDDAGRGMDPRMREDDRKYLVIPAEPALDLIGGQESIPVFPPTVKST
jgi:hypothetical protein